MDKTSTKSFAYLLEGEKLYIQRARLVLPILIRQAKAQQPLTYSQIAEEIGMPNARNLNYILGAIGRAIDQLSGRIGLKEIPMINCLVVNKSNGLPGDGISGFRKFSGFDTLPKNEKRVRVMNIHNEIFYYPFWDKILKALNLQPASGPCFPLEPGYPFIPGGGEGERHKEFKIFVSQHPELFDLNCNSSAELEHLFGSMDAVDVLFSYKGSLTGIEVKSFQSNEDDIYRGLFQCVKYRALIEAEQIVKGKEINCHVILALEGKFPRKLLPIRNLLGIEVFDQINIDKKNDK